MGKSSWSNVSISRLPPPNTTTAGHRTQRGTNGAEKDSHKYAGHSYRIGAATTASLCGIQDSTIKMLGRWQSSAYTL